MERMRNKDLENAWAVQGIRQEKCAKLEEENKNLKSDLAYERTMLDNVRAEYKSLQNVNKKLKDRINELIGKIDQLEEENENLRKDLFHLTNNGQRRNQTATSRAEGVKGEGGEEQGKDARDS